jgi:hypothetical protein
VDTQNLYAFAAFDPINSWDPYGACADCLSDMLDFLDSAGVSTAVLRAAAGEVRRTGFNTSMEHDSPASWVPFFGYLGADDDKWEGARVGDSGAAAVIVEELVHAHWSTATDKAFEAMRDKLVRSYGGNTRMKDGFPPTAPDLLANESMAEYARLRLQNYLDLLFKLDHLKGKPRAVDDAVDQYRKKQKETRTQAVGYQETDGCGGGLPYCAEPLPVTGQEYVDQVLFGGSIPDEPLDSKTLSEKVLSTKEATAKSTEPASKAGQSK